MNRWSELYLSAEVFMLINQRTVRIEWGDCDPGGIVYFPRYFEMG